MIDWLARVRPWLNALLVLLLLLPVAQLVWRVVLPAEPKAAAAPARVAVPATVAATRMDVGRLRQAALFGHAVTQSANGELPESTLPLKLQGVIAAGESRTAAAIFESADPKLRAARVGMELQPGVVVKAVFKDRVVISNNGRDERISLKLPPLLPLNGAPGGAPGGSAGGPPVAPSWDNNGGPPGTSRNYMGQSAPGYNGGMPAGQPMNQPPQQYPGYNGPQNYPQNYPGSPGSPPPPQSWQTQ